MKLRSTRLASVLGAVLFLPTAFAEPPNCSTLCKQLIVSQNCRFFFGVWIPFTVNNYLVTDCSACTGAAGLCVAFDGQSPTAVCGPTDEFQTITVTSGSNYPCNGCLVKPAHQHETTPPNNPTFISTVNTTRKVCPVVIVSDAK